jgi:hypothetical protein
MVGEHQDLSMRERGTAIACDRGAGTSYRVESKITRLRKLLQIPLRTVGASIIHDNDLEAVRLKVLPQQAADRSPQRP